MQHGLLLTNEYVGQANLTCHNYPETPATAMKNLKLLEHMEMEGHFEYNQTPLAPLVTKVCLVYWNIP